MMWSLSSFFKIYVAFHGSHYQVNDILVKEQRNLTFILILFGDHRPFSETTESCGILLIKKHKYMQNQYCSFTFNKVNP